MDYSLINKKKILITGSNSRFAKSLKQYLYGAQDDLIVNPFGCLHFFLLNLRGSVNIFWSFLMHFLDFFVE